MTQRSGCLYSGSFALLNYLYADVLALFVFVGSPNTAPHLPPWALMGSAVLMGIAHRRDCGVSTASSFQRTGSRISSRSPF